MSIDTADRTASIITEDDLQLAPMEDCHKELVIRHYRRLIKILHEHDEAATGTYTNKQAAREQLARMTLVIRDYMELRSQEQIESMVADIIDASFSFGGMQSSFCQPTFVNSTPWGREQEVATLMQEFDAGSIDDVLELWNLIPEKTNKVVPDSSHVEDIGKDVDWNTVLLRSRSEDNILFHRGEGQIEDRVVWEKGLRERQLEQLDLSWPPVFRDPEPNVGRQRRRTGTGASASTRPRALSRAEREEIVAQESCDDAEMGSSLLLRGDT